MAKQLTQQAQPAVAGPEKLTVQLDSDLRQSLEAERRRVEQLTGYRVSFSQIGERLLRRGLD